MLQNSSGSFMKTKFAKAKDKNPLGSLKKEPALWENDDFFWLSDENAKEKQRKDKMKEPGDIDKYFEQKIMMTLNKKESAKEMDE